MATGRMLGPLLFAVAAVAPSPATAADTAGSLPVRVHEVFLNRCGACHGPELRKPKGKFGYVTDLARLAGNPKLVVPSKPDESRLWQLVEAEEMPPEGSRTGPLTADESELIHDWIAAGAPVADESPGAAVEPVSPASPAPAAIRVPPSLGWRLLQWLGKFHVLMIHFPIALLMVAAGAAFWCLLRRRQ